MDARLPLVLVLDVMRYLIFINEQAIKSCISLFNISLRCSIGMDAVSFFQQCFPVVI